MPIFNEAESIEATLREIRACVEPHCRMRFLLCEDGSTDGTPEILDRLQSELPIRLVRGGQRKGYSRAVIDGFRAAEAPLVLFLDSDGQVDPAAFPMAYERRNRVDVVVGWRVQRRDAFYRLWMSRAFRTVYRMLFHVHLHDPSCPFLLVRTSVVRPILDDLGVLKQGFWWEFVARLHARGCRIEEMPVVHRERASGVTKVYTIGRIPGIATKHVIGLFRIRRELALARARAVD